MLFRCYRGDGDTHEKTNGNSRQNAHLHHQRSAFLFNFWINLISHALLPTLGLTKSEIFHEIWQFIIIRESEREDPPASAKLNNNSPLRLYYVRHLDLFHVSMASAEFDPCTDTKCLYIIRMWYISVVGWFSIYRLSFPSRSRWLTIRSTSRASLIHHQRLSNSCVCAYTFGDNMRMKGKLETE